MFFPQMPFPELMTTGAEMTSTLEGKLWDLRKAFPTLTRLNETFSELIGPMKKGVKTYNPFPKEPKFPKTGIEEVLTYLAVIQLDQPKALTDKEAVGKALDQEGPIPTWLYNEKVENRYYLPKEIEDLPEKDRPDAVLKLLQQIKSSSALLKNLNLLPEQ